MISGKGQSYTTPGPGPSATSGEGESNTTAMALSLQRSLVEKEAALGLNFKTRILSHMALNLSLAHERMTCS